MTTLFINRDDWPYTDRFSDYTATVGNYTDVTLNPVCVAKGTMPDGGWYKCTNSNSMIGKTFGVFSSNLLLNFMEIMAYSQEAIQMGADVTVSFLGTNANNFPASNALQKIVVLLYTYNAR
jgi:hypothetical protein